MTSLLQFGYLNGGLDLGGWTGVSWSVSVETNLSLLFPAIRHFLSAGRLWSLFRVVLLIWLVRAPALALGADVNTLEEQVMEVQFQPSPRR